MPKEQMQEINEDFLKESDVDSIIDNFLPKRKRLTEGQYGLLTKAIQREIADYRGCIELYQYLYKNSLLDAPKRHRQAKALLEKRLELLREEFLGVVQLRVESVLGGAR